MVKKGRSSRLGILSAKEMDLIKKADKKDDLIRERDLLLKNKNRTKEEIERIKLLNKEIRKISSRFSSLVRNLDKRIAALGPELLLILKSPSLAIFVRTRRVEFFGLPYKEEGAYEKYGIARTFEEVNKVQFEEYDGTELLQDYSKWRVKIEIDPKYRNTRYYWLDTKVEPVFTTEDIFQPDYAIKGIKGIWFRNTKRMNRQIEEEFVSKKIDVRVILREALKLEKNFQTIIKNEKLPKIFPRSKDEAVDIIEISNRIKNFSDEKRNLLDRVPLAEEPSI